nr:site-specific integrase [Providencia sp. 1701011]QIF63481.1 site-specific integrase [Providencia sp. 1701091]
MMARFSAKKSDREIAKRQAANVMKSLQGHIFQSVGTVRNYQTALTRIGLHFRTHNGVNLQDITPEMANQYFDSRAASVGQKSLDMERQALQAMMVHLTRVLPDGHTLRVVRSLHKQSLSSRSYTSEQIEIIASHQSDKNRLATRIAYQAGLRSHELFSLREWRYREPSVRPASDKKFMGRGGVSYTVHGKGGLVREIKLAAELAKMLESRRLAEPVTVTDRGIHYQQFYAISAGQAWSRSFSNASTRALGWSAGSHGTRHSYAQARMAELQDYGCSYDESLEVVSQEMGHFRAEITKTYLR